MELAVIAYLAAFVAVLVGLSVGLVVGLLCAVGFAAVALLAWATM